MYNKSMDNKNEIETFSKNDIHNDNGWLSYYGRDPRGEFVARFKKGWSVITAGAFRTRMQRWPVAEYFQMMEDGMSPLDIARVFDADWVDAKLAR